MWSKLMSSSSSMPSFSKFSSAMKGHEQEEMINLRSPLDLHEEYSKALRTKSYIDLYSKIHNHNLNRTSTTINVTNTRKDEEEEHHDQQRVVLQHAHSSPMSHDDYIYSAANSVLEPSQESTSRFRHFHLNLNTLLLDFFNVTHQACIACTSLLSSIDRARSHHHVTRHLLTRLSTFSATLVHQLSSHLELENPLSPKNLSQFRLVHSLYPTLIGRLTYARRKISRRLKLVRLAKKASGISFITLIGVVAVAAVIIASHAAVAVAVAVAAVPVVAVASGGGFRLEGWRRSRLEREKARVDAAEKGAYIIRRDLDTMSRMVKRVHDEVEHGRDVARMVVRNGGDDGQWVMVREMVKEMEGRGEEVGFGLEEQLEELEEHAYLCLITINRSRRLVAQDIRWRDRRKRSC